MPLIKVDWSNYDNLLGIKSDKEIAALAKCTEDNVRYRRNKLSIQPAINSGWTNDDISLLNRNLMKCVKCYTVQSVDNFYKEENKRVGHKRTCKSCLNSNKKNKWQQLKSKYIDLMGGECQNCGYATYLASLQFHHVQDNKDYTLSRIICSKVRESTILCELDKCCLLCSNCHDAYHSKELIIEFSKRENIGWTISSKA